MFAQTASQKRPKRGEQWVGISSRFQYDKTVSRTGCKTKIAKDGVGIDLTARKDIYVRSARRNGQGRSQQSNGVPRNANDIQMPASRNLGRIA